METRSRKRARAPDYEYNDSVAERSAKRIKKEKKTVAVKNDKIKKESQPRNKIKAEPKNSIKSEVKREAKKELKTEKKETGNFVVIINSII